MVKVFCDMCGAHLESDYSDVVVVRFGNYGVCKFKYGDAEKQLCKKCAEKVYKSIKKTKGEEE